MVRTLRWDDFSLNEEAFHVAGLSSGQARGAGEHTHDGFAECFLVISGRVRHLINGQEQILRAGQFIMIRSPDRHDFQPVRGENFTSRNIAFREETLDFIRMRYFPAQHNFWGGDDDLPAGWTLADETRERMERRIARLMTRPRKRIYIEQFLLDVLTDPPPGAHRTAGPMPDWLELACEAVRDPAASAGGITAFFRLAGRSPEHVSRELKRCTGETPTELVNRLRLEQAARRLLLSGEDITTIAYNCGFETLSYFSSLFKKRFGLTPREYRKKHRTAVFGGGS
jgi:AraC family cel operon transcriptional repressor